jgi:hypothetical protein
MLRRGPKLVETSRVETPADSVIVADADDIVGVRKPSGCSRGRQVNGPGRAAEVLKTAPAGLLNLKIRSEILIAI